MAEKMERKVVRGKAIYQIIVDADGIEAIREDRPLGLGYGNYVRCVYVISTNGDTKHYVVNDGWAYRGSMAGCTVEGEGFIPKSEVEKIVSEVKELLSVEDKENVIKAYAKVKKIVEESFADIEPSI